MCPFGAHKGPLFALFTQPCHPFHNLCSHSCSQHSTSQVIVVLYLSMGTVASVAAYCLATIDSAHQRQPLPVWMALYDGQVSVTVISGLTIDHALAIACLTSGGVSGLSVLPATSMKLERDLARPPSHERRMHTTVTMWCFRPRIFKRRYSV